MYEFVTLSVKCPECGTYLMDHKNLVDNVPSIKLGINVIGASGSIWISATYGSYNFKTDIEIPEGAIAEFTCSHCNAEIISKAECSLCEAPLIPLVLDIGGKVHFCSRKGCKNHNVEFEDLSVALKKLYSEFGFRGRPYPEHLLHFEKQVKKSEKSEYNAKEIIETGTYLSSYCPHCKKSLMFSEMVKLEVTKENGERGELMLSPYFNVFSSKSTIFLPEEEAVSDISCVHCHKSLVVKEKSCEECGTSIARILVSARTKFIDFYICSKKGCKWHGLSDEDVEDIRLEDSLEW